MKRSRFSLYLSLVIALSLAFLGLYFAYRYFRRWALISIQREKIIALKHQADQFMQLGFDPQSEVMQLVDGRIQWVHDVVKHHAVGNKGATIAAIISLNKNMLASYLKDLQDFRALGAARNHPIIVHAYDKTIRLTLALAELERQYIERHFDSLDDYAKRIERMCAIASQSIEHYIAELSIGDCDEVKDSFIKNQLAHKMRLLSRLERLL